MPNRNFHQIGDSFLLLKNNINIILIIEVREYDVEKFKKLTILRNERLTDYC